MRVAAVAPGRDAEKAIRSARRALQNGDPRAAASMLADAGRPEPGAAPRPSSESAARAYVGAKLLDATGAPIGEVMRVQNGHALLGMDGVHDFWGFWDLSRGREAWVPLAACCSALRTRSARRTRCCRRPRTSRERSRSPADPSSARRVAAALVIRFTDRLWVDSLVAAGIGLWILPRTLSLLLCSVNVMLAGVPEGVDIAAIEDALGRCDGVARRARPARLGDRHRAHDPQRPRGARHGRRTRRRRARAAAGDARGPVRHRHSTLQLETVPCELADGPHVVAASGETH